MYSRYAILDSDCFLIIVYIYTSYERSITQWEQEKIRSSGKLMKDHKKDRILFSANSVSFLNSPRDGDNPNIPRGTKRMQHCSDGLPTSSSLINTPVGGTSLAASQLNITVPLLKRRPASGTAP